MSNKDLKSLIHSEINKSVFKTVTEDEALLTTGLLDSIAAVDLAIFIEENSGISVPFQEINESNFDTLNKIMAYLASRQE